MVEDYLGLLSSQVTVDIINAIETIRDTEKRDICRIRDLTHEIYGEENLESHKTQIENRVPKLEDILVEDYDLRSGHIILKEDPELQRLQEIDVLTPEKAKLLRYEDRREILGYLGEKGEVRKNELVDQFAEEERKYHIKLTHHYLPQFKDHGVIEEKPGDMLSYQGGEELLKTLEEVEEIYHNAEE